MVSKPLHKSLLFVAFISISAHATSPVPPSAYQKSLETIQFKGESVGPAQQVARLAFAQCNLFRQQYGVAELWPDPALLAGVDTRQIERFYADGMARTLVKGYTLAATDLQRWLNDSKATPGSLPKTAPDCSVASKQPIVTDSLWRDGTLYHIDHHAKRVRQQQRAASLLPTELLTPAQLSALPKHEVLRHACVQVSQAELPLPARAALGFVAPSGGSLSSCLWQAVPLQAYLNFPWPLESVVETNMAGKTLLQRQQSIELNTGGTLPAETFALPVGYQQK